MDMTSTRPYLVRAIYDWIIDNRCTPYLLLDAAVAGVRVPRQAVKDGRGLLSVAPHAVGRLELGKLIHDKGLHLSRIYIHSGYSARDGLSPSMCHPNRRTVSV